MDVGVDVLCASLRCQGSGHSRDPGTEAETIPTEHEAKSETETDVIPKIGQMQPSEHLKRINICNFQRRVPVLCLPIRYTALRDLGL